MKTDAFPLEGFIFENRIDFKITWVDHNAAQTLVGITLA
jgi:hypothetical protein